MAADETMIAMRFTNSGRPMPSLPPLDLLESTGKYLVACIYTDHEIEPARSLPHCAGKCLFAKRLSLPHSARPGSTLNPDCIDKALFEPAKNTTTQAAPILPVRLPNLLLPILETPTAPLIGNRPIHIKAGHHAPDDTCDRQPIPSRWTPASAPTLRISQCARSPD